MLLSAFRRFQNFQRRHGLEFNVAGAVTGLVTGTILAVGFLTRSDATPAPAPHGIGWLTGPVLTLIHDGGIWHLLAVSFLGGVEIGALTLYAAVQLRYFHTNRHLDRWR